MNDDNIYQYINGELVALSPEEKSSYLAEVVAWESNTNVRLMDDVRKKRNHLLLQSDWAIIRALETGADYTALHQYRQQLRDLPQQEGFPSNVAWPTTNLL
ncbi:MAG: phage tail assembly chaperone [Puniceicoccales bacterium]|nr:phage tail assembly chaperone [Puniceicoccales bacterium]